MYLSTSIGAVALLFVIGIILLFIVVPFSLKYFYLYFLFVVWCIVAPRIVVNECTSRLIVDDNGVETTRSLKNVKILWPEIARIEYCGKRLTMNERIVLHSENGQKIYISLHRKNYLDAFKVVMDQCKKRNPNVLIDQDLQYNLINQKNVSNF